MNKIIAILGTLIVVICVGCMSISELVTPATIDQRAVSYVVDANLATPEEFSGYPNLYKADKLEKLLTAAHQTIQFQAEKMAQEDTLTYNQLNEVATANRTMALQREEQLFGTTGLLSTILPMLGFGSLTGIVGLLRKRPGDITKEELSTAVAEVKEETASELSDKEKQIIELVMSVQSMFNTVEALPVNTGTNEDKERVEDLKQSLIATFKSKLDGIQDTATQVTVATVKKTNNIA